VGIANIDLCADLLRLVPNLDRPHGLRWRAEPQDSSSLCMAGHLRSWDSRLRAERSPKSTSSPTPARVSQLDLAVLDD
jgi:hypothetical protein